MFEDVNLYEDIISKIVVMLLIYLILNRALGNLRYRVRALIVFLFGITLSGAFLLAYFLDKNAGTIFIVQELDYFVYIIVNLIFAFGSIIFTFTKYRKNDFVKYKYEKTRYSDPTSTVHYKKFLYLVFEYKNEYLFKKTKETYSGINIALKNGNFHDVVISDFLKKHNSTDSIVTLYGEYTDNTKREVYYVYLINLDKQIDLKKHEYVFYSRIRFLDMADFDKELIFRVLIKEKFNIEK